MAIAAKKLSVELITIPEIAFMCGVERGTPERWRLRNQGTPEAFPEPDDRIGSTPVWRIERVTEWLDRMAKPATEGRAATKQYDVEAWRKHRDAGGFWRKPA